MPQQPGELNGPFSNSFLGLSTQSPGRSLDPAYSPVFHNCLVNSDGAVVRRRGTNVITTASTPVTPKTWTTSIKLSASIECLVTVRGTQVLIQVFSSVNNILRLLYTFTKSNVWKATLSEVNFVTVTAPFNRVIIFTGNHPPVQISLLFRDLLFTCNNASTQSIVATYSPTDSKMWLDTTPSNYLVIEPASTTAHVPATKTGGFSLANFTPSLGLALNQQVTLSLLQVSWQWWAEALLWEGKDFARTVSRTNVTDLDQNIQVPLDLITDLNPRHNTSPYIGLTIGTTANVCASGVMTSPVNSPLSATTWGHSTGSRYVPAANVPLNHSPLFVTYGQKEASGISSLTIVRQRELRFNKGQGIIANRLQVRVNSVLSSGYFTDCAAGAQPTDYVLFNDTYGTDRSRVFCGGPTQLATGIAFTANGNVLEFGATVELVNTENRWMGTAGQSLLYSTGVANLDGTFLQAFGLGLLCDYDKGFFPTLGSIYRDRLVLRLPNVSLDQLLVSATSDIYTPGEYYSYFQVTDALAGDADDPFTINVTNSGREPITALLSWQQQLFVFTSVSTYGIRGGEVFGPSGYTSSLFAAYGALNQRCVISTNLTVLFLNKFGVFDLLNKDNTSDYGAFERSSTIRSMFESNLFPSNLDSLAFITFSPTKNLVYCALPTSEDSTYASRMLCLDLSWSSWSTMSSAVPFCSLSAAQIFDFSLLYVTSSLANSTWLLSLEANHYIDFYTILPTLTTLPVLTSVPSQSIAVPRVNSLYTFPVPLAPSINDFNVTNATKVGDNYIQNSPDLPAFNVTPRNYMVDFPLLSTQLPVGVTTNYVCIDPGVLNSRPCYALTSGLSITGVNNPDGGAIGAIGSYGVTYPSIYTSPSFDLDSLGRLKRLRRLHLTFNTDITLRNSYTVSNFVVQPSTSPYNSALVVVTYSYNTGGYTADYELVSDTTNFDASYYDTPIEAFDKLHATIPLQGYGADYQFSVVSTGVDPFKLSAYELDVRPQQSKRYVR